jgi:methylated-DNA-protein-cysteine methyltransferase-like protein
MEGLYRQRRELRYRHAVHRPTVYAPFTARAVVVIRAIPRGKVATYGLVAALAGSPLGARQVVRVLHALSRKERLPWHRVINSRGSISLPRGAGFEKQRALLRSEGVAVTERGRVDFDRFLWKPRLADAG